MSRSAQRARMEAYSARELHDTAWGQNIDAALSTVREIDANFRDQHEAGMATLDACIAAIDGLLAGENRNV